MRQDGGRQFPGRSLYKKKVVDFFFITLTDDYIVIGCNRE